MTCLFPHCKPSTGYRYGCRCDRCRQGMSRRLPRPLPLPPVRLVSEPDGLDESPERWARRVWAAWTPAERAEVAGALSSLLGEIRGAGDGSPAPHRAKGGRRPLRVA